MSLRIYMALILALLLAVLCLLHPGSARGSAQEKASANNASGSKQTCLNPSCHGPFEKHVAAVPSFELADGRKINPHMYVPHDMKEEVNIPTCTSCHKPHPVPLRSKEGLVRASLDSCYDDCHHTR